MKVEVFARPRNKPRVIQLILREMAKLPRDRPMHAAIAHADVLQEAEDLRRTGAERFRCREDFPTALRDFLQVDGHTREKPIR
jgi:hypothetical protein